MALGVHKPLPLGLPSPIVKVINRVLTTAAGDYDFLDVNIPTIPAGTICNAILVKVDTEASSGDYSYHSGKVLLYYYDEINAAWVQRGLCIGQVLANSPQNAGSTAAKTIIMDISDKFNPGDTVAIRISIALGSDAKASFGTTWIEVYYSAS